MMRDRQLLPIRVSAMDGVVMYETNFGFHRQPFQCVDLPRAFFVSESIRSVLPQLLHALRSDLGIAVLTGPAGVGKTSLLKHLQSLLANDGRVVLCSGAGLVTPVEVLNTLQAASLSRSADASADVSGVVTAQNRWTIVEQMRKTTEFWGPVLLLVDDAQLLSVPVLNELRAFTEEEWQGRALVRCLIAGPLNLEEELARPAQADFSRRVRCHAFLKPLSSKESLECLNRHLTVVGGKLKDVFTPEALNLIAIACDGLPRCLTLLADEALVIAAERSTNRADEDCVRTALKRLQHLAYAWNVSPEDSDLQSTQLDPDAETPVWTSIVATSNESLTTGNSSGVFEIGAPPASALMDAVQSHATQSEASPNLIESASSIERRSWSFEELEAHRPLSVPEQVNAASFEFGLSPTQGFEVGHRYLPDALEASDVVEMDEFAAAPISPSDALTSVDSNEPTVNSTSTRMPPDSLASAGAPEQHSLYGHGVLQEELPSNGGESSSRDSSPISTSSQAVHFLSHDEDTKECLATSTMSTDSQEQVFRSAIGADLTNRLPVFDRYTWIALGRDVPSGTYAVSSASDMRRVTDNETGTGDEWLSQTAIKATTSFDRIAVSRTTDSDIMAMLKSHQANPDEGDFVAFPPGPAFGQVSQISTDPLVPQIKISSVLVPQIFASEVRPLDQTTNSPNEDEVISDENRQVIQNAIRSGLLAGLADAATSVPSADRFDVVDSFSTLNDPATIGYTGITDQFQINGWHDGQLIFNAENAEQTEEPLATPDAATPPEPEHVSLNFEFEAARLARNGQTSGPRDPANASHQEPERSEPKFFSLPNEVRSLEWDLRGSILSTDDTGPLADSLASLRDEVSRFQKTGRITSTAELKSAEHDINFRNKDSGTGSETLLSAARNRIESFAATESHVASAMGNVTDSVILTQTVIPASNAEQDSVLAETAVLPEPASSAADNRSPAGASESADFSPRYSQLFTKLRQVRSRVAGNR